MTVETVETWERRLAAAVRHHAVLTRDAGEGSTRAARALDAAWRRVVAAQSALSVAQDDAQDRWARYGDRA
jgi:hypothetical protein